MTELTTELSVRSEGGASPLIATDSVNDIGDSMWSVHFENALIWIHLHM